MISSRKMLLVYARTGESHLQWSEHLKLQIQTDGSCADRAGEGGGGQWTPPENHQNIGFFLVILIPIP